MRAADGGECPRRVNGGGQHDELAVRHCLDQFGEQSGSREYPVRWPWRLVSQRLPTLGSGLFDAEVVLADGSSVFLRVTLILESGPRLRTVVEPIHP